MIIEILQAHGKWQVGATPDVTRTLAQSLVSEGVARIHADQTRRDYTPAEKEPEPQPITVNNYFLAPEAEQEQLQKETPEPKRRGKRKNIVND